MLPIITIVHRLLWAALMGAAIGLERNIRKRPAGMRTSMCVCIGAALFTILSSEIAKATGDSGPTRIASNIVQGIGFLGAGVILRDRGSIIGLTTAATIFVEAAIGMACGGGFYRTAGVSTLIVLGALVLMVPVENLLNLKRRVMKFEIVADSHINILPEMRKIFGDMDVKLEAMMVSSKEHKHVISFNADVSQHQQDKALAALTRTGVTVDMRPPEKQYE